MRRTKAWWAALDAEERSHVVRFERWRGRRKCWRNEGREYLPRGWHTCAVCGFRADWMHDGMCPDCIDTWAKCRVLANMRAAAAVKED